MTRVRFIGIVVAVALLGIALIGIIHKAPVGDDTEAYWESRISMTGAANAYKELEQFADQKDPSLQHRLSHVFGGALYNRIGIDGFAICDMQFSYGCYHEFIGKAVLDQGLGIVNMLDRACAGNTVGCQHGIGHGILAYLGYSSKNLVKTLELCAALPDDDALQGCDAGAYMEYNLQTMAQSASSSNPARMPDPGGLYAPCNSLSQTEKPECYQWQPQWWWVYFTQMQHFDPTVAYNKIGELCEHMAEKDLRSHCIAGAGLMAPPASAYDPHRSASLCDAAFTSTRGRLICRGYAANVYSSTRSPAVAQLVCDDLEGSSLFYCDAYAKGEANIAKPLPLP